jgi:diacylglycerol kinase family enzyme
VQIVANPRSGDGRALALGRRLAGHLRTNRYDVQLLETDDLARIRQRLRRVGRDLHGVICVGGDYTLNQVAAVAAELEVPLLPVPAGFGNILARNLGYGATPSSVVALLEHGRVQRIDAGSLGKSLFLANHTFGFTNAVQVAVETAAALPQQRWRRYLHYWRAAARLIATAPLPAFRVEVDGARVADAAVMVVVANVPTFRGFLALTPDASPFDGLLDVFVVPAMPKLPLLALLLAFFVHAPGRWGATRYRRGMHVRVTPGGRTPQDLRVLPAAVPLLLPQGHQRVSPATTSGRLAG